MKTLAEKFEEKIFYGSPDGCHYWIGAVSSQGYGLMVIERKLILAHRLSYTIFKGEIPEGLLIRHSCDNTLCVNPDHLLIGTHKENTYDMVVRGRHTMAERNSRAKLNRRDVNQIRFMASVGVPQKDIAKLVGTLPTNISRVINNIRYKSI